MDLNQISKDKIIEEIKRVAKKLGQNQLSRSEFKRHSDITEWHIYKRFDSWNDAVEKAGLRPHIEKERIDKEELFLEMERVFIENRGVCTQIKFRKLSKYSPDVYKKRFGKWINVLIEFKSYLESNEKEFPYFDSFPTEKLTSYEVSPKLGMSENIVENNNYISQQTSADYEKNAIYGEPINFRGLLHAPVNEQGVVYLFGMVSKELGFLIELVRTSFPDCAGKRCIDKKKNHWIKVDIEFEYKSKNFSEHGHNPDECDLIVCWIHDWEDCPLEVIELKTIIQNLDK